MFSERMKIKKTVALLSSFIAVLIAISIVQTGVWLSLFSTPLFKEMVFFYRGIIFLLISVLTTAIALLVVRNVLSSQLRSQFDTHLNFERCLASLACCSSLGLSFFVIVPVTIERSVTTFMLGRMEQTGPLSKDEIHQLLSETYMKETHAVDRRTFEQIASGNLKQTEDGKFELTKNASHFLRFSEIVASVFHVKPSYRSGN